MLKIIHCVSTTEGNIYICGSTPFPTELLSGRKILEKAVSILVMPSPKRFTSFLCGLVISSFFVSTIATPVRRDVPDALRPRQSAATPHPLDYAPDFSKDPFPPWPNVYNDNGSNITTENWRGTKLFGWKGCDGEEQRIIVETMKQFYKLAQQEALWKDIDWDSQAAKEIWGHGTGNKEIFDNVKLQIKRKCSHILPNSLDTVTLTFAYRNLRVYSADI